MKHGNKHWEREKEYISLLMEKTNIRETAPRNGRRWWRVAPNERLSEIEEKLRHKFYNEYRGMYRTAPKWYRKMLNKSQRAKSKQTLYRELQGYDVCYEDNYKDCAWYW